MDEGKLFYELWQSGKTYTDIAHRHGVSDSTVGNRIRAYREANGIGPGPRKVNRSFKGGGTVTRHQPPAVEADVNPLGVRPEDMRRDQCHFPYGNATPYKFCGHPVQEGSPYCPDHHKMCRFPPKPINLAGIDDV